MEANRLNWDDRTAIHLRNLTGFYPIDRVRAGDDAFVDGIAKVYIRRPAARQIARRSEARLEV